MKTIIVILILFIETFYTQNLQIELKLSKTEYLVGEYITPLVQIKNLGTDVLIEGLGFQYSTSQFEINFTDITGKLLQPNSPIRTAFVFLSPCLLKQDSSFYCLFPLGAFYGNNPKDISITGSWDYLLPGKYTVNVIYTYKEYTQGKSPQVKIWEVAKGIEKQFTSNSLTFTVKPPSEEDDKLVYDKLKNFQQNLALLKGTAYLEAKNNFDKTILELITKFPNNSYLEVLYLSLITWNYELHNYSEVFRLTEYFIDRFPNSHSIYGRLNILNGISQDEKSMSMFFDKVLVKFKNAEAVKIWQRMNLYHTPSKN